MCIHTDDTATPVPVNAKLIHDNSISQVYRTDSGKVVKRSIPYLIENEIGFVRMLESTPLPADLPRYWAEYWVVDKYTLALSEYPAASFGVRLGFSALLEQAIAIARHLRAAGIVHGDLTLPNLRWQPEAEHLLVIDWAEARLRHASFRPKRPETDLQQLCHSLGQLLDVPAPLVVSTARRNLTPGWAAALLGAQEDA